MAFITSFNGTGDHWQFKGAPSAGQSLVGINCGILSPMPSPRLVATKHGMDIYEGYTPHRVIAGYAHRALSAEEITEISQLMESL